MNYIEGNLIAQGLKIGIAAARFNEFIVSKLVSGAEDGWNIPMLWMLSQLLEFFVCHRMAILRSEGQSWV